MMTNASKTLLKKKVWLLVALLLSLLCIAIAWRWSSLGEWLDIQKLVNELREQGENFGPIRAIASVALASVAAIPLAVIIMVSAIAFGSWLGLVYALSGACVGAVISYAVGNYLGHEALCRLAGERANRLSSRLAQRGILAIIFVRMMPIAPFAIVNMIAGATHIRLRDFLLGTLIGMIPGALAITVFADQIVLMIAEPNWKSVLLIVLSAAFILCGALLLRVWHSKQH
jgi:uncharacterized membrane protein YdjX (TVP38/TMEM64 family)